MRASVQTSVIASVLAACAVCAASAVTLAACSDALSLNAQIEPPPPPAKQPPATRIREDFINTQLIERQSGVLVDVNKGLVTLPTIEFPEQAGDQLRSWAMPSEENGVVAAQQILVEENAVIRASDSIELVAANLLRVTGEIHAGRGGVTLAAGEHIIIDGIVDSEGPVRILLAHDDGTIEISGTVSAIAPIDGPTPNVQIIGRGSATITGKLETAALNGIGSGDVIVDMYGKITVTSYGQIGTSVQGVSSGEIHLRSETEINIFGGGWIGDDLQSIDPMAMPLTGPTQVGDIHLEAQRISLGANSNIIGASSPSATGGSIMISAGAVFTMDSVTTVAAGSGHTGGKLLVEASSAQIGEGSRLLGGVGLTDAGLVRAQIAGPLHLAPNASIVGGDGVCAKGGDVTVLVADVVTLDNGAAIRGGSGGLMLGTRACPGALHKGGDVDITARAVVVPDRAITGGDGATPGMVTVTIDPSFDVPMPNLAVSTLGSIVSRLIDRGDAQVGQLPKLLDLQYMAPPATTVVLELGGTLEPTQEITDWYEVTFRTPEALEPLRDARYFRYRVTLGGRAFDSPVLDFFEIDLAPMSGTR